MNQEIVSQKILEVLRSKLICTNDIDVEKTIKNMVKRSNPYSIHIYDNDKIFLENKINTYLNKSWETIYGNILESIAIQMSGGSKSYEIGMDIVYTNNKFDSKKYLDYVSKK